MPVRHLLGCNGPPCDCEAVRERFPTRLSEELCPACLKRLPVPKTDLLRDMQAPPHYRREHDERVRVQHDDGSECVIERVIYDRLVAITAQKHKCSMTERGHDNG